VSAKIEDGRVLKLHPRSGDWIDVTDKPGGANLLAYDKKVAALDPKYGLPTELVEKLKSNDKLNSLLFEAKQANMTGNKDSIKEIESRARNGLDAQLNPKPEIEADDGYKMQHQAPDRSHAPSGDDLTNSFGSDIYSHNALRYFGEGRDYDAKAIGIIKAMKNKPHQSITIYRAVPKEVKKINPKDWIATTREYAKEHMEGEKGWHILSKKVKAKHVANDGNSIHEFGYDPE
jgi:hypothetical protein